MTEQQRNAKRRIDTRLFAIDDVHQARSGIIGSERSHAMTIQERIDAPADFSTNWERYLGEAEDA